MSAREEWRERLAPSIDAHWQGVNRRLSQGPVIPGPTVGQGGRHPTTGPGAQNIVPDNGTDNPRAMMDEAYQKFTSAVGPAPAGPPGPAAPIPSFGGAPAGGFASADGGGFNDHVEFDLDDAAVQAMVDKHSPGMKLTAQQLKQLATMAEQGGKENLPAVKAQADAWQPQPAPESYGSVAMNEAESAMGVEQTPAQIAGFMNPLLQGLAQGSPGVGPDQASALAKSNVFTHGFGDADPSVTQLIGRGLLSPLTLLDGVINGNDMFPGVFGGLGLGKEARRRREVLDAEAQAVQARKNMDASLRVKGSQLPGTAEARAEHQQQAMLQQAVAGYDGKGSGGIAMARPGVTTSDNPTIMQGLSEMFLQTYGDRRAEADAEIRAREAEIGQYGRITATSNALTKQSREAQVSRQAEQGLQQRVRSNDLTASGQKNTADWRRDSIALRRRSADRLDKNDALSTEHQGKVAAFKEEQQNWTRLNQHVTGLRTRLKGMEEARRKAQTERRLAIDRLKDPKTPDALKKILEEENNIGKSMTDNAIFANTMEYDGTLTPSSGDPQLETKIRDAIAAGEASMAKIAAGGGMEVTSSADDDYAGDDEGLEGDESYGTDEEIEAGLAELYAKGAPPAEIDAFLDRHAGSIQ